jgi:hypothetical protein
MERIDVLNDGTLDKVMEKIRKLMRMTESPNENEAAVAAGKAQALLAEYNLSLSDVRTEKSKDPRFVTDEEIATAIQPWRRLIGNSVAALYFCKYMFYSFDKHPKGWARKDRHMFVGAAHNIEVAKMMFVYLMNATERLAKEGAKKVPASERDRYTRSFCWACSSRLAGRIHLRIEAAKQGGIKSETTGKNLPALLDAYEQNKKQLMEYIKREGHGEDPPHATLKGSYGSDEGLEDGIRAGDKIGLDPQVGQSSTKALPKS